MFLQQQLRFKLLHYIQKFVSASMAAALAFFTDKTRRPGTRMPTKRAGGWLEEGANGRRGQYRLECRDLYVPHKKRFGPTDPDRNLNHLRVGCACTYAYIALCMQCASRVAPAWHIRFDMFYVERQHKRVKTQIEPVKNTRQFEGTRLRRPGVVAPNIRCLEVQLRLK